MMKKSVVIIGGGLGGLFTGAILAKEGLKVTILEKNSTIGGGLQTFNRLGESFDTGMHVVCGMNEGGNILQLCRYLGIDNNVKFKLTDEISVRLFCAKDSEFVNIKQGKTGFVDSLSEYFPEQRNNLTNYVNALYEITDKIDLYNLRPSNGAANFNNFLDNSLIAASQLIANNITDFKLRNIVAYTNTMYGGVFDSTPAYVHAMLSASHINGIGRLVGKTSDFADLLANLIINSGGEVLTSSKVDKVCVEDKTVQYVLVEDKKYFADYYISDIHPSTLFQIVDGNAFPRSYTNRINGIKNSYSAFSVYVKLKTNVFPYINSFDYYVENYDDVWKLYDYNDNYPLGFMFMTPADNFSQKYASKALIIAPMPFSAVEKWSNSTINKRDDDYKQWKEKIATKIFAKLEQMFPNFSSCVQSYVTSSPLTIRDYYGVKDGSMFGLSKDCNNFLQSYIPVATKVKNLLLTGQNVNLHGFCGVPLSSIITSEAILGENYVINKIANQ